MNVSKITRVAGREFASTALTKGFIIGGFIVPAVLMAAFMFIGPMLINRGAPEVVGELAVVDKSGEVFERFRAALSPEEIEAWQADRVGATTQGVQEAAESGDIGGALTAATTELKVPTIRITNLGPDLEGDALNEQRAAVRDNSAEDDGRLALLMVDPNATQRAEGETDFGGYTLTVQPKLDPRLIGLIEGRAQRVIREVRAENSGQSVDEILALSNVRGDSVVYSAETGQERDADTGIQFVVSFVAMALLMMGVMFGGQYLLTTTIEEKSSRVVEVLLSSCSAFELMTGKILGQMLVGGLILVVYGGGATGALITISMADLIPVQALIFLPPFFVLTYLMIAALMAAIGSAVNELREAQSLMAPVMMIIMVPYMLGIFIAQDPSSTLARVTSMAPAFGPFVMITRIAAGNVPAWEIAVSLAVATATALASLWFAAKVFRVGLLMFGKPPSFGTMIKWVRMA
ncbi:MAG: ABC transporter permease [Planctomycetota bacterium]